MHTEYKAQIRVSDVYSVGVLVSSSPAEAQRGKKMWSFFPLPFCINILQAEMRRVPSTAEEAVWKENMKVPWPQWKARDKC